MRKKTGIAFMTAGVLCIISAAVLLFYNSYENKNAQKSSAELMKSIVSVISENELKEHIEDPFDTEMKTEKINGYDYIGYLYIAPYDLLLPVMSEWDYTRLKISPCRYYGSTKTDNLVIAAHNYTSHFGYLGKLKPGDSIIFTDMEGSESHYLVTLIEVLQPTDVEKVKDTGDDLILYTCTYRGVARVTVRCERINP